MHNLSSDDIENIRRAFNDFLSIHVQSTMQKFEERMRNSLDPNLIPADLTSLLDIAHESRLSRTAIGFDGQIIRSGIVVSLLRDMAFDVFIETGTLQGATCFLVAAQTNLPIKSCELPHRAQSIAHVTAQAFGGRIELSLLDSRDFLTSTLRANTYQRPFFYLDAHWEDDIPLLGELEIILRNQAEFAVMIDDFRVPHDSGFGFDSYKNGTLEWSYIKDTIARSERRLKMFYPSYSSAIETDGTRGFILLVSDSLGVVIGKSMVPRLLIEQQ